MTTNTKETIMTKMLTADEATEAVRALDYKAADYYAQRQAVEEAFAAYLADDNFSSDVPEVVISAVYSKAYSEGHSSGYHEVEHHYVEFAELADLVISAVKNG